MNDIPHTLSHTWCSSASRLLTLYFKHQSYASLSSRPYACVQCVYTSGYHWAYIRGVCSTKHAHTQQNTRIYSTTRHPLHPLHISNASPLSNTNLLECNFLQCCRPLGLHHFMQRQQGAQHTLHIRLAKIQSRSLL